MTNRQIDQPIPDIGTSHEDITIVETPSLVRRVVVLGAGGHGRELADIVRQVASTRGGVELIGIADDNEPDRAILARSGIRFLGPRTAIDGRDLDLHLGVGYPHIRSQIDRSLRYPATPLIHPSATVGSANSFDDGVVLAQGAIVTTNVRLGRHTHVNVGASLSHDCVVGNYVTICPGVTLAGSVLVGDSVFIGAGATVLPGVSIGDGAVIGAGAVVATDVPAAATFAGVPARKIRG